MGLRPVVIVLRTGRAVFPRTLVPAFEDYAAIGRHWLGGTAAQTGQPHPVFLNWRTGEQRYNPNPSDPFDEEGPLGPDLSSPGLVAVDPRRTDYLPTKVGTHPPLILVHRGHRIRLSRCPDGCGQARVGGGRVVWSTGDGVAHGYHIATKRRFRWRLVSATSPVRLRLSLFHTRYAVLSVKYTSDGPGRIYSMPWRRR